MFKPVRVVASIILIASIAMVLVGAFVLHFGVRLSFALHISIIYKLFPSVFRSYVLVSSSHYQILHCMLITIRQCLCSSNSWPTHGTHSRISHMLAMLSKR